MTSGNAHSTSELNREWAQLAHTPVPTAWPVAAGTMAEVLALIEADPDPVLAALLAQHTHGDRLAGRVVLQAMLGRLVVMASRDHSHPVADYLAECWLLLSRYPLCRRPQRIGANLAMDTRRAVWAADAAPTPIDPVAIDERPAPAIGAPHHVLRTATRLGLIDPESAACLAGVHLLGLRSHEVAQHLSISPALVRWRNARSIRALAPHAQVLAQAA